MRIVVIGGTGLIGAKLVTVLRGMGQAVISASRSSGVDVFTGAGLPAALADADAVIDVTNPPGRSDGGAEEFFVASATNLLAAERAAGVSHHIGLSIVGADRVHTSGYFRAKAAQEAIVAEGDVPFSILRSTQFFEFADDIADWNTAEDTVRLPDTAVRPVASDDVVTALVSIARETPIMGTAEIAGPEEVALDEFVRKVLLTHHDERYVVRDVLSRPYGFNIEGQLLAPDVDATLTQTTLAEWLQNRTVAQPPIGRHAASFSFSDSNR